jgi:SAM-dependent methyltransferase
VRVDFSAEAVRQACEHAWRLGRTGGFRRGNLAAAGLGDGSVDAVLWVDAIQFSQQPDAACCELPRVPGPGGRAVLTCWEPLGQGDERLPGRLRRVDLAARLTAVGFSNMEVRDRLGWRAREQARWQEAAALDPGDDPALQSFQEEGHALPRNPRPDTPGHRHRHRTVDAHLMR